MSDKGITEFWQDTFGVQPGDEIVIHVTGGAAGQPGQGFQGALVNLVIGGDSAKPLAIVIRQAPGLPVVTIAWHCIQMIAKAQISRADAEAAEKTAQALTDLPPRDVLAFFEENNIEVPEELRQAAIDQDLDVLSEF